jgi:hypothetical protein
MPPLIRFQQNKYSPTGSPPDIELGEECFVDADFGASLKDTIVVVGEKQYHAHEKKNLMLTSVDNGESSNF